MDLTVEGRCRCHNKGIRPRHIVFFVVLAFCAWSAANSESVRAQTDADPVVDDRFLRIVAGERVPDELFQQANRIHYHPKEVWGDDNSLVEIIRIKGKDIAPLRHANGVCELSLDRPALSGRDVKVILELPHLKRFEYYQGAGDVDEVLEVVSQVERLERLVLAGSQIRNRSMSAIANIKNLKYLDLEDTGIDASFFKQGIHLPHTLTHLRLDGISLDNAVIEKLPVKLTHLSLSGTGLKPDVIPALRRFRHLEELVLYADDWSVNDYKRLESQLPGVQVNSRAFSRF